MDANRKGVEKPSGVILAHLDRGEAVTITYRGKPRARLVGIEQGSTPAARDRVNVPAFGMWKDRSDMADVAAGVRNLRKAHADAG